MNTENKLPSKFDFGEDVHLYFGWAGRLSNCKIVNIKFSESKVFYDVDVLVSVGRFPQSIEAADPQDKDQHTRIYNIDSAFVGAPTRVPDNQP